MLWALASSAFVIYLYRSINTENARAPGDAPANTAESEIAALNARISALERAIGPTAIEEKRP
jgi:hypothetical protein